MEYNYYVYVKPECDIKINKMPKWFAEQRYEGNKQEGTIEFETQDIYDEYWGPTAKLKIYWEPRDQDVLFFGREIQESIKTYSNLGIIITLKENSWHLSHEFTIWYGSRNKMLHKRFYTEKTIHSIFYCNYSKRLINLHAEIIEKYYKNFEPYIISCFKSVICHPI